MSSRLFRLCGAVGVVVFAVMATFSASTAQAQQGFLVKCAQGIVLVERGQDGQITISDFLEPDLIPAPVFNETDLEEELDDTSDPDEEELLEQALKFLDFCHETAYLSGRQEGPRGRTFNGGGLARFAEETGDPDGNGMLIYYYNLKSRQTCYALLVQSIQLPATSAQIYRGEIGQTGEAVLKLKAPAANGISGGCFAQNKANEATLKEVLENPTRFYVNVHNKEFPDGAIRGQMLGAFKLDGMKEKPGPGDRDGYGVGSLVFDEAKQQLCYSVVVSQIALPAEAAHIHLGKPGEEGKVLIPIRPPDKMGFSIGCVEVGKYFDALYSNRYRLYVNVHTKDNPKGAVRGQPPF
jgi:hypothetical protein